ncbi:MAG: hypothetical protein RL637_1777 [Pseudomonadota bacterium]|jgi:hypothetical protein
MQKRNKYGTVIEFCFYYSGFMLPIVLSRRFYLIILLSLTVYGCSSTLPPAVIIPPVSMVEEKSIEPVKNPCPPVSQSAAEDEFVVEQMLPSTCWDDSSQSWRNADIAMAHPTTLTILDKSFDEIWLLIDTHKMSIEVKRGEQTIATLSDIAIGQSGAGAKRHRGDNITPLGEYRIGWFNPRSQFHKFYGLTYPSVEDAKQAIQNGSISQSQYDAILYAQQHHLVPPQNTPLGGQVGLHGLGNRSEKIHQLVNWTHGCIAVTNAQVDELSRWVVPGTRVKIE